VIVVERMSETVFAVQHADRLRFVVRHALGHFYDDKTGRAVCPVTREAIDHALRSVRSATAPPG
jgi:hypothetical protein